LKEPPSPAAFRRRPFYGIAAGGTLCAAFLHGKLRPGRLRGHGEWRARRNFRSGEHLAGSVAGEGRAGGALRCECDRAGAAPTARRSAPSPANGTQRARLGGRASALECRRGANDPRLRGNCSNSARRSLSPAKWRLRVESGRSGAMAALRPAASTRRGA